MTELFKLVIIGVAIFTIQQVVLELWIKPLLEFRRAVEKLDAYLFENSHIMHYVASTDLRDANVHLTRVREELRTHAANISSSFRMVFFIERFYLTRIVHYQVLGARNNTIRLSNLIGYYDRSEQITLCIRNIRKDLRLEQD